MPAPMARAAASLLLPILLQLCWRTTVPVAGGAHGTGAGTAGASATASAHGSTADTTGGTTGTIAASPLLAPGAGLGESAPAPLQLGGLVLNFVPLEVQSKTRVPLFSARTGYS